MTNPALPSGSHGAEGDSEKKKWGYKREQFAAVITNTKLNGAIERLVDGTLPVRELLRILDELNGSSLQGRTMAEMLALKQESRKIATIPFSPAVAEFLIEGSKRIPLFSDGLASQLAVTLASAADNHEYLDTVNTAVGRLLVNLDHPLKPDTRNYLRALTDKIDATRRLQQARSQLSTVPSVYPPASEKGVSPLAPPVAPAQAQELLPRFSDEAVDAVDALPSDRPEPNTPEAPEVVAPLLSATKTLMMPVPADVPADVPTPKAPPVTSTPAPPAVQHVAPSAHSLAEEEPVELEPSPEPAPVLPPPETTERGLGKLVSAPEEPEEEPLVIPTKSVSWLLWLGLFGAAVTILSVGAYAYLRTTSNATSSAEPSATASGSAAPSASVGTAENGGKPTHNRRHGKDAPTAPGALASGAPVPPKSTEPPLQTAKNATLAEVRAMEAKGNVPAEPKPATQKPVVSKPVEPKPVVATPVVAQKPTVASKPAVAVKPVETKPVAQKPVETKPVENKPIETKPTETKPTETKPAPVVVDGAPRTPTPAKDIDQLFSDMRQVPNDVGRIEALAHEVSRIVSRSVKPEAEKILTRMTPEELLFGMESYDTRALEPLRRVVALTLLKVAVDKDDGRAALAIEMLGVWAKSRKHGSPAKLTLDQLAEEPVVLSRLKRRQALERVQQRLGISAESVE